MTRDEIAKSITKIEAKAYKTIVCVNEMGADLINVAEDRETTPYQHAPVSLAYGRLANSAAQVLADARKLHEELARADGPQPRDGDGK